MSMQVGRRWTGLLLATVLAAIAFMVLVHHSAASPPASPAAGRVDATSAIGSETLDPVDAAPGRTEPAIGLDSHAGAFLLEVRTRDGRPVHPAEAICVDGAGRHAVRTPTALIVQSTQEGTLALPPGPDGVRPDLARVLLLASGFVPRLAEEAVVETHATGAVAELEAACPLQLTVRDPNGMPAAAIPVVATTGVLPSGFTASREMIPGSRTDAIHLLWTDAEGTARFEHLPSTDTVNLFLADTDYVWIDEPTETDTPGRMTGRLAVVLASVVDLTPERNATLRIESKTGLLAEERAQGATMQVHMTLRKRFPSTRSVVVLGGMSDGHGLDKSLVVQDGDGEETVMPVRLMRPSQLTDAHIVRVPPRTTNPAPEGELELRVIGADGALMPDLMFLLKAKDRGRDGVRSASSGTRSRHPAGKYEVSILGPSFESIPRREVEIPPAGVALLEISLTRAYRQIEVEVITDSGEHPSYCIIGVTLNGQSSGARSMRPAQVPLLVPVGDGEITVKAHGYREAKQPLTVHPGKATESVPQRVRVVLEPKKAADR